MFKSPINGGTSKILKPAPPPIPHTIRGAEINLLADAKLVDILQDSSSRNFWSQDAFTLFRIIEDFKELLFCGLYLLIFATLQMKTGKI